MATTREVAVKLAAKVFAERGNGRNVEVHLSRSELEGILQVCSELTIQLRPEPQVIAEMGRKT